MYTLVHEEGCLWRQDWRLEWCICLLRTTKDAEDCQQPVPDEARKGPPLGPSGIARPSRHVFYLSKTRLFIFKGLPCFWWVPMVTFHTCTRLSVQPANSVAISRPGQRGPLGRLCPAVVLKASCSSSSAVTLSSNSQIFVLSLRQHQGGTARTVAQGFNDVPSV